MEGKRRAQDIGGQHFWSLSRDSSLGCEARGLPRLLSLAAISRRRRCYVDEKEGATNPRKEPQKETVFVDVRVAGLRDSSTFDSASNRSLQRLHRIAPAGAKRADRSGLRSIERDQPPLSARETKEALTLCRDRFDLRVDLSFAVRPPRSVPRKEPESAQAREGAEGFSHRRAGVSVKAFLPLPSRRREDEQADVHFSMRGRSYVRWIDGGLCTS